MTGPRWAHDFRVFLAVGAYLVVLVGGPLGCHDLTCHVKSPTHCSACQMSPTSSGAEPRAVIEDFSNGPSARIELHSAPTVSATAVYRIPGRSPPPA
jgi:hypothetical protein